MAHFIMVKDGNEGKFQKKVNELLAQGYIFVNGAWTGNNWAGFLIKQ